MLLGGGATHRATSSKNKRKSLQDSSISAIVDCHGNDSNVLYEGDYHDDNGSYLSGFLVSDGIACDITAMCEWLCVSLTVLLNVFRALHTSILHAVTPLI